MNTHGGNILIVDDKPNNLDILVITLSQHGYTAITAKSGREALQLPDSREFDLILLDIMMPGVDGYTVFQQIKQNQPSHDIPVVFMSSLMDMVDKMRGFEVGAV